MVVVPHKQLPKIKATVLGAYYFEWGDDDEDGAILFGLCQLCNHSYEPNARYVEHHARKTMEFIAIRDIAEGAEVTINYNGELGCVDQLKFRVRR